MVDRSDLGPEAQNQALLEKINACLEKLGSTSKWIKAPEFLPEYEALRDKKILLVDDVVNVIEGYIPDLVVATQGKADFILYNGETLEQLVQHILQTNSDIVLVDYNLSQSLKGDRVIKEMRNQFSGKLIGFSSNQWNNEKFKEAGADGSVEKQSWSIEVSIKELAELLK